MGDLGRMTEQEKQFKQKWEKKYVQVAKRMKEAFDRAEGDV